MNKVVPLSEAKVQVDHIHGPRLSGTWKKTLIGTWLLVWLVSLVVFGMAIYYWFRWDSTPAAQMPKFFPLITPADQDSMAKYQAAIQQAGLSLAFYGGLFAILRLVSGIPYFVLSALIVRRRSDRLMVILFAIVLAVIGAAGRWISPNWVVIPDAIPGAVIVKKILDFLLSCSGIILYAFPDGRFVPRWTRWAAIAVLVSSILENLLTGTPLNYANLPGLWGSLPSRILLIIGLAALAYRYIKGADTVKKQQIKWIVLGMIPLAIFYIAHYLIYQTNLMANLDWTPRLVLTFELALEPPWYVTQIFFAVCIGVSVLRYRLWDIDIVVNRVLVFGSLTLLTMAVYLAVVSGLSSLFHGISDPLVFFLATGLVAIVFEPLRQRLQRGVNRLMYGERDDPYAVLTRLSNALEESPTPGMVLPSLIATIQQALKLPYVAIHVQQNGEEQVIASTGKPQAEEKVFPVVYQSETIGSLRLALRARNEQFSSADLRLIETISRQVGAAVQAIRLNAELIRSRAEIVTAREEERRRLRRELHDGLGPILASQTLKMAAVRQWVRQNPERAETTIDDVIHQNEVTVTEMRRLVYGLRPPALDELGLVEAVRDLVHRGGQNDLAASGLRVQIEGPESGLPRLPAAVEVNAYRIALEALTNVARHANAQTCVIHFRCIMPDSGDTKQALFIEICDDGIGIPEGYRAGVGLRSMRERAEELGGRLEVQTAKPNGTLIHAWLPLIESRGR